jgi:hypothetical protein
LETRQKLPGLDAVQPSSLQKSDHRNEHNQDLLCKSFEDAAWQRPRVYIFDMHGKQSIIRHSKALVSSTCQPDGGNTFFSSMSCSNFVRVVGTADCSGSVTAPLQEFASISTDKSLILVTGCSNLPVSNADVHLSDGEACSSSARIMGSFAPSAKHGEDGPADFDDSSKLLLLSR